MTFATEFADLLNRSVVIVTRTYGDPDALGVKPVTEDESDPYDGYLEPLVSTEVLTGQTTQIATHLLILPAGPIMSGNEGVLVDGDPYEIVGPPRRFDFGGEHHIEAHLVAVTG